MDARTPARRSLGVRPATTGHHPPHASRPRSVPPMNPPAPCAVTLPAHRPPASHRRPLHSACRRPAAQRLDFQPAPCATIHVSAHRAPQKAWRGARWRYEPRSSFACPRPSCGAFGAAGGSSCLCRALAAPSPLPGRRWWSQHYPASESQSGARSSSSSAINRHFGSRSNA
jgi:hypothetical protein